MLLHNAQKVASRSKQSIPHQFILVQYLFFVLGGLSIRRKRVRIKVKEKAVKNVKDSFEAKVLRRVESACNEHVIMLAHTEQPAPRY